MLDPRGREEPGLGGLDEQFVGGVEVAEVGRESSDEFLELVSLGAQARQRHVVREGLEGQLFPEEAGEDPADAGADALQAGLPDHMTGAAPILLLGGALGRDV